MNELIANVMTDNDEEAVVYMCAAAAFAVGACVRNNPHLGSRHVLLIMSGYGPANRATGCGEEDGGGDGDGSGEEDGETSMVVKRCSKGKGRLWSVSVVFRPIFPGGADTHTIRTRDGAPGVPKSMRFFVAPPVGTERTTDKEWLSEKAWAGVRTIRAQPKFVPSERGPACAA